MALNTVSPAMVEKTRTSKVSGHLSDPGSDGLAAADAVAGQESHLAHVPVVAAARSQGVPPLEFVPCRNRSRPRFLQQAVRI
jgi:hypothetical protein